MSVKKYRVYCNTDSKFVTGWAESEPTTCFENNTHAIDTNQTTMTDIQLDSKVELVQTNADATTQDNYFLDSETIDLDKGETKTVNLSLDVDVNMFGVTIHTNKACTGDIWSAHVNKDTVIGVISETSSGTDIKMIQASVDVVVPGYFLSFDGGATYIKAVSKSSNVVTMKSSVSVTLGDVVMMTYFMVYKKEIIVSGVLHMGSNIFGSFKIPKEYVAGITYENKSPGISKRIVIDVETTF